MSQPELWLVRHGQTEWSRNGRHTSTTDLPLTSEGEQAARQLAERLAGVEFDMVLSSPRQRALETARLAGVEAPLIDDDVREWDYGDYEGITTAQIREARPGWRIWTDGTVDGESPADVGARADRLVGRVRAEAPMRALVFGHGHFSRVIAARWLELPVAIGGQFTLDTATVSVLAWERETPAILRWNA